VTNGNGVSTDFVYHANGNLLSTTQLLPNGGRVTSYAYNNNGQPSDVSLPTGGVARYRYNAATRLVQVGNSQGEYVQLQFDVPSIMASSRSARNVASANGATPVANASGEFVKTSKLDSVGRPYTDIGNNGPADQLPLRQKREPQDPQQRRGPRHEL
jgi:YD repeat-containing protein